MVRSAKLRPPRPRWNGQWWWCPKTRQDVFMNSPRIPEYIFFSLFFLIFSCFWLIYMFHLKKKNDLANKTILLYLHISHIWVIPYKSTEKNVTTFFLDFWPKKSKSFDILVVKTIFKQNFGYFWPLLKIFKDFFIFQGFKNEIFNRMFYYFLSSQKCYTFCHRSKSL